ncbi:hypothetical protein ABXV18_26990 [Vibrio owensii]|uniref:hypothetical protein n=1 Tax=Vibrio owensii TaxID=696485 RepID=UPI00339085CD
MSKRADPMDQIDVESEDMELDPNSPEFRAALSEFAGSAKLTRTKNVGKGTQKEEVKPASVELKSNHSVKMIINGRMKKRDETMIGCNFYLTNKNAERIEELCSGNKGLIYNKLLSIALDQLEATDGLLIYTDKDIDY